MGSTNSEDEETTLGGVNRLNRLLAGLDERGLILSLAAFAEETLGELLKTFMLPTEASKQLLQGFNAPLGTLSARIRAAHALGLVTTDQFEDLERMRKIRNAFSHSWEPVAFSDAPIAALIEALNWNNVDETFPETPTNKVRASLGFLVVELQVTAAQVAKRGTGASLVGTRLVAGLTGTVDEQLAQCRSRIRELQLEIASANGERQVFLRHVLERWKDKATLTLAAAPAEREKEVALAIKEIHDSV